MIDLKFDHVSKKYMVRQEAAVGASGNPLVRKLRSLRRRARPFWAVHDVSFEVRRGEALGIIGHNGAGKSTILKLLSNITTPTSGEIKINGRLSALIEVGSGFHPELTGRENIYLNGSILGMRRREISRKLDSIVDFAGVRQFIDTPVKRYSSGMYVRLGFSIAAFLDPDILLLDEVLAVGDAAFQTKCLERITELKRTGTTIVFISHDLGAVERLCDRVLLMERGEVAASGAPRDVIAEYQRRAASFTQTTSQHTPQAGGESKSAAITSLTFHDATGHETNFSRTGDAVTARFEYEAREHLKDVVFEIIFFSGDGNLQCQLTTEPGDSPIALEPGVGVVEFSCAELGLQPGIYHLDTVIKHRDAPTAIDWQPRCAMLRVDPGKLVHGRFYLPHSWRVTQGAATKNGTHADQSFGELASRR
ncbi:MAG TPA: ABC transporter ATP-binding protein [Pyrinomonadaceae bacterium]|jgi:ABC-type polysaccharide/polyol phosphate transport system ATPase subunit